MKKTTQNFEGELLAHPQEDFEALLQNLNTHLVTFEKERYLDLKETLPSIHVIGVPRSGTTLMNQLICSHLDIGYINNLIARFWQAPVTAIHLSRKLLGDRYTSSYKSAYGKTNHIQEPHEFNFFWSYQLNYDDLRVKSQIEAEKIEWKSVAHTLKNIIHAFKKPVAFKSFLLGWHAQLIQQHLTKTCFVLIKRNPLDNALSLLDTRDKYFGSRENWSTLKPQNYESLLKLSPYEQVAAQVYYMEKTYQDQLDLIPKANYRIFKYEEVCKNPSHALKEIQSMLNNHGGSTSIINHDFPKLNPSSRKTNDTDDIEKTKQALEAYFSLADIAHD